MLQKYFPLLVFACCLSLSSRGQSEYQPYSYQFYQKFNSDYYSLKTDLHTSLKPVILDSATRRTYSQLMDGAGNGRLYHDHLLGDEKLYADLLPDFTIGSDLSQHRAVHLYSLGAQAGGNLNSKLSFYASGYLSQAQLPSYLNTYATQTGYVTGQGPDRTPGQSTANWRYFTATLSYTPVKFVNFTVGRDKNFVGDGYRSLFLSDAASPYDFLRMTATMGHVRYMALWSYMDDPFAPATATQASRKKWGAFHYLDWNVTNRFSVGFYDSVIWPDQDNAGNRRGFDFTYAMPITFLRPIEASNGSPDNALIGFTAKYKVWEGAAVYGQFMLDEFEATNFFSSNGSSRNKYGYQLGIRGSDLFHIKKLNYLLEFNDVKPYTYSETEQIINYTEANEPLAHPFGANFRELVGFLNYSYKRFDFSLEGDYGHYGLDINGLNYGKNPFNDYTSPAKETGNYIGQGLTTNMYFTEGKAAYLLNPRYNLRLELGLLYRRETNAAFDDRTAMVTFGLRSSFRNIYNDIASFKTNP